MQCRSIGLNVQVDTADYGQGQRGILRLSPNRTGLGSFVGIGLAFTATLFDSMASCGDASAEIRASRLVREPPNTLGEVRHVHSGKLSRRYLWPSML